MPEKGRSAYRPQASGRLRRSLCTEDGAVLVPMQNAQNAIVGLQVIYPEAQADTGRDKSYWPHGMAKEGAFHMIGGHPEPGEPVLVCEGYATGASLHMATSQAVAIAFDAGNLMAVAKHMRERFPVGPSSSAAMTTGRPSGPRASPGIPARKRPTTRRWWSAAKLSVRSSPATARTSGPTSTICTAPKASRRCVGRSRR